MVTWSNTTPENYAEHIVLDIRPQKAQGGVTRQGVVPTDLQSLLVCQ